VGLFIENQRIKMKELTIRYIIFRFVEEYKLINNQVDFNIENNFTIDKCLQLPFFITIANGHKEKLIKEVFNNSFYPKIDKRDGVVVGNMSEKDFKIYNAEILELIFENNKLQENSFVDGEFNELDSNIKNYVDKSIKFIKEVRKLNDFAKYDTKQFKEIAMENFAFDNISEHVKEENITTSIEIVEFFQEYVMGCRFFLSQVPEFGEKFNWELETA